MEISLIICTHNPRVPVLNKVLDFLQQQTLPRDKWELIIIDNNSAEPVEKQFDLSWHPNGRVVREEKTGLTFARMCGIESAKAPILLFVDDDNYLDSKYIEICLSYMNSDLELGCVGAGEIIPEFEIEPPKTILKYASKLALRNEPNKVFTKSVAITKSLPYGAGICIRKWIAEQYVVSCKARAEATVLGRSGNKLLSGEDADMALHACKNNLSIGITPELKMVHYIYKSRLTEEYFIRLIAGHEYSGFYLSKLWGFPIKKPATGLMASLRDLKRSFQLKGFEKQVYFAKKEALKEAYADWKKMNA